MKNFKENDLGAQCENMKNRFDNQKVELKVRLFLVVNKAKISSNKNLN